MGLMCVIFCSGGKRAPAYFSHAWMEGVPLALFASNLKSAEDRTSVFSKAIARRRRRLCGFRIWHSACNSTGTWISLHRTLCIVGLHTSSVGMRTTVSSRMVHRCDHIAAIVDERGFTRTPLMEEVCLLDRRVTTKDYGLWDSLFQTNLWRALRNLPTMERHMNESHAAKPGQIDTS